MREDAAEGSTQLAQLCFCNQRPVAGDGVLDARTGNDGDGTETTETTGTTGTMTRGHEGGELTAGRRESHVGSFEAGRRTALHSLDDGATILEHRSDSTVVRRCGRERDEAMRKRPWVGFRQST